MAARNKPVADRPIGYYWVKDRFSDCWVPALWQGGKTHWDQWTFCGHSGEPCGDDYWADIGVRVQRPESLSGFVVFVLNNEGGCLPSLLGTVEDAKAWVKAYLIDPENDPPISEHELTRLERDLAVVTTDRVCEIRGSDAWKEWLYIAPLDSRC